MADLDYSFPLRLTINAPKTPRLSQRLKGNPAITRAFRGRGLRLSDRELNGLLGGRHEAIETLYRVFTALPGLSGIPRDRRMSLAVDLADALMGHSLEAQLSREAPNALDRDLQRSKTLEGVLLKETVASTPIIGTLTIHF